MSLPDDVGNYYGLFVPTTNVWDTDEINNLEEESAQLKELLIRLYQNLNRISLALNLKDSAIYDLQEFVTGAGWFPGDTTTDPAFSTDFRPVYRKVLNSGALPNSGLSTIPHNITCTTATSFTKLYGVATNPVSTFKYMPLPYSSVTAVADNIELYADGTNVYIKTAANYSALTISYVIIEYIQIS